MTDSRFLNAVIGAVVTLLFSFTGFSPVLGGAVAAWLEEGDRSASVTVGALSGALAFVPIVLLFVGLAVSSIGVVASILLLLFGTLLVGGYVVGLAALGGYLAYYVMKDRRIPGERVEA